MNSLDFIRSPSARLVLTIEILLLVIISAQAARLIWIVAAPPIPASTRAAAPKRAVDLSVLTSFDAFGVAGGAGAASGSPGGQGFRLFGVRASGSGGGSAIIAGADGLQQSYAVGDQVADGVVLAAVAADHVELARGGARSILSFPENQ